MALAYVPPGVSVQEQVSPSVSPILASPANVCIVGLSRGNRTRTDQLRVVFVSGDPVAQALPGLPAGAVLQSVTAVSNAVNPADAGSDGVYAVTTDYTVNLSTGTITVVEAGTIADGDILNIEYTYLPENYFTATRLDSFSTVEDFYGRAWSTDGNSINSALSYAAGLAFENGAATVVCQPLFERVTPGDVSTARRQPTTDAAKVASTTWADTLYALRDIEDINVVVPAVGQTAPTATDASQIGIIQTVQDHIQYMRQNDQYIVGIFGEDGTGTTPAATQATLRSHIATVASRYAGAVNQHLAYIEPSKFERISPISGQPVAVGGQYVAAAYAGMLAARPVSASLTRKQVAGVSSVLVPRTKQEKNEMAQLGFTVIEQSGTAVRARHAITLDATSSATRELNVVRAKHRMIESIRDTLDNQIIGEVVADDNAPLVVRGAVIGVLEQLQGSGDLVGYRNVEARTLSLDPTTIEVRFSYRPAFAVNYVNVVFSIDLTSGNTVVGT